MNFLSVLKAIGHGLEVGVADATTPTMVSLVSAVPGFGTEAGLLLKAIGTVESLVPVSKAGAAKKVAVTALVTAAAPALAAPAAAATLSKQIDAIVAHLNGLQAALSAIEALTKAGT